MESGRPLASDLLEQANRIYEPSDLPWSTQLLAFLAWSLEIAFICWLALG